MSTVVDNSQFVEQYNEVFDQFLPLVKGDSEYSLFDRARYHLPAFLMTLDSDKYAEVLDSLTLEDAKFIATFKNYEAFKTFCEDVMVLEDIELVCSKPTEILSFIEAVIMELTTGDELEAGRNEVSKWWDSYDTAYEFAYNESVRIEWEEEERNRWH